MWTWSLARTAVEIPTRVGMDRVMRSPAAHDARDPHARGDGPAAHSRMVAWMARSHARGDGPSIVIGFSGALKRSPRAWGWTAL